MQIREEETKRLESYISKKNLWISTIDFNQYVSEGAEQKVFLKAQHKQPFYRIVLFLKFTFVESILSYSFISACFKTTRFWFPTNSINTIPLELKLFKSK